MRLSGQRRAPGSSLLRLYPREWRDRYEAEVSAVLAARRLRRGDRFDLVRGALDAHLHPVRPSSLPGLTALAGGGAWAVVAVAVAAQPVPPDWPGYLVEVLPLAFAGVVLLLPAIIGAWLRTGDGAGAFDRLAVDVAFAGYAAWAAALLLAILGIEYGVVTGVAMTAAATGSWLVALSLLRHGDWRVAGLLGAAPAGLVGGAAIAWLGFGAAWSAVGAVELRDRAKRGRADPG